MHMQAKAAPARPGLRKCRVSSRAGACVRAAGRARCMICFLGPLVSTFAGVAAKSSTFGRQLPVHASNGYRWSMGRWLDNRCAVRPALQYLHGCAPFVTRCLGSSLCVRLPVRSVGNQTAQQVKQNQQCPGCRPPGCSRFAAAASIAA
jgi:hypothetical protein